MEGVSWEDAQGFIAELNRREGVSVVPAADRSGVGVCGAGGDADGVPFRERGESVGAVRVV